MSYVVLTMVPRLTRRPKPGEDFKTGIREVGCVTCVIGYDGKVKLCWKHKNEHVLWAEKAEEVDVVLLESEELPEVGPTARTEELVEVP